MRVGPVIIGAMNGSPRDGMFLLRAGQLRRVSTILACFVVAGWGLTGCFPASERAQDNEALKVDLMALPAVTAVSVTNHVRFSTDRNLEVTVRIGDDVESSDLAAIQDLYTSRVDGRARTGQAVAPLSIQWCIDSTSLGFCDCPQRGMPQTLRVLGDCSSILMDAGVSAPNEDWLRLRQTPDIRQVQIVASRSKRTIKVESALPARDLAHTVRAIRESFPDLANAAWQFHSLDATIDAPDRIPDEESLLLWDELRANGAHINHFRVHEPPNPSEADVVSVSMRHLVEDRARTRAIEDLNTLQHLGRPVIYLATIAGDATLEVLVNGCTQDERRKNSTPAPALQTELRSLYERC